jgi:hypothetical protein
MAAGPRRTAEEAAAPVKTVRPDALKDVPSREVAGGHEASTGAGRGEDGDSTDEEASKIVKDIIKGISEGDYQLYIRDFAKKLKKAQSRETFLFLQRRIQKRLGKLRSVECLGHYVQSGNRITLFKARFRKDKDDVLIKLVLRGKGPDLRVTGIWFDSPRLSE